MNSAIPIELDEIELKELISKAKDWALVHGVAMRRTDVEFDESTLAFAPFTLFPSPMKRSSFEDVVALQSDLTELMNAVANDDEFLESSLKTTILVDDFTKKLYDIYIKVKEEGVSQNISLVVLRNDVFITDSGPKQVEINTIASGFAWLGPASRAIHSYVLNEIEKENMIENLPKNTALHDICSGIIKACELYGPGALLFLVEEKTYNICDQRLMEFEIRKLKPDLKVIRKTFSELNKEAKLGENKELLIKDLEIAVIYMRTGYSPSQYKTGDWNTRLLLERSKAIKCPNINYHLAGTKKIQQILANSGILERFIQDKNKCDAIRKLFTEIYSLDVGEEGTKAYKLAMKRPSDYVLKPQREGGGNNIYGATIARHLEGLDAKQRQQYILMKLIKPVPIKNYIIRRGARIEKSDVISELGIFSVAIGKGKQLVYNKNAGHMLRTKLASSNEGGVASGSGALDSPILY